MSGLGRRWVAVASAVPTSVLQSKVTELARHTTHARGLISESLHHPLPSEG